MSPAKFDVVSLLPIIFLIGMAVLILICVRNKRATKIRPAKTPIYLPTITAERFKNPANGYEEEFATAWLWCLLFGCVYFAVKGVWTHAAAGLLLAICTLGASWLIYPFFAKRILQQHYFRLGWQPVSY